MGNVGERRKAGSLTDRADASEESRDSANTDRVSKLSKGSLDHCVEAWLSNASVSALNSGTISCIGRLKDYRQMPMRCRLHLPSRVQVPKYFPVRLDMSVYSSSVMMYDIVFYDSRLPLASLQTRVWRCCELQKSRQLPILLPEQN